MGLDSIPKGYYPYPYSQAPLPVELHRGLYGTGLLGLASTMASLALLTFIVYRMTTWQRHYRVFVGYNQYVVLIMNLLIADFLQAVSFLFSFHWIRKNAMLAPSTPCFAQGFLLNVGDLTSAFFVMAIALHTFYTAVKGRRLEHTTFLIVVIGIWVFGLTLSIIGPGRYGHHYFVKAGAWCWASPDYETDRLALHYIWIFIVQFGTIVVYIAVLLQLKAAMKAIVPHLREQSDTFAKVDRAARLMVLYPFFYIVLTLPLSAGRMWSMAHHGQELPNVYQCVAGTLLASSGLVDALLYTLTRKTLLAGDPNGSRRGGAGKGSDKSGNVLSLSDIGPAGITQTRTVTVTGHVLDMQSDDEDDRGRQTKKTVYHNFERHSHSPTGSLDPIIGVNNSTVPERHNEKAVKFASDVLVTTTALDDHSEDGHSLESGLGTSTPANSTGRNGFRNFSSSS